MKLKGNGCIQEESLGVLLRHAAHPGAPLAAEAMQIMSSECHEGLTQKPEAKCIPTEAHVRLCSAVDPERVEQLTTFCRQKIPEYVMRFGYRSGKQCRQPVRWGPPGLRTLKPVLHSPRESFGSNLQLDCDVVTMKSVAFVEWFVGK